MVELILYIGKLDCLRESLPTTPNETPAQKAKREAANWTSDCSFEANSDNHWKSRLEKYYGLTKGLVDVEGNPVENDFEDQADMCEIVRALVANGNQNLTCRCLPKYWNRCYKYK